jgi:hypothetical protein
LLRHTLGNIAVVPLPAQVIIGGTVGHAGERISTDKSKAVRVILAADAPFTANTRACVAVLREAHGVLETVGVPVLDIRFAYGSLAVIVPESDAVFIIVTHGQAGIRGVIANQVERAALTVAAATVAAVTAGLRERVAVSGYTIRVAVARTVARRDIRHAGVLLAMIVRRTPRIVFT